MPSVGGSVYLDTVKNTHVEVSYGKTYRDSEVARENVGLDFSTTPFEIANFYGRAKYDTKAERYNELLFGAKLAAPQRSDPAGRVLSKLSDL